ncbi:MAG: hypothetical protein J0L73_09110 [Verrucomicrobia bacterium]|nr:hypothetical protein [Verrucomicrobiota bacterium]
MKSPFRPLLVVSAILSLANCDKPLPPAAAAPVAAETDNQLAEARDALQRQALEIETKTALMDKQLAEMAQSLKDRDNAELRTSLEALKRQNEELRGQADAARQQSDAIAERIPASPPLNVAPQPMALPDYSLFYEGLSPYGRWFEVNGYGYCWRPTITVAGWRPYVDGCWVWSSLGWAWQSNEPFGWATYHYGRWVNLARYGWIWVPGSDWAPAWVAWRQSRDCVGWAPLPPETGVFSGVYRDCDSRYGLGPSSYTFINTTQFVSPTYIHIYAPVTRQTTIFQNSVNVTQIVPSHSRGHAFVHQGGPPRSQMEQACGRPVPQRQVQSMHADQMPTRLQHHGSRDADAPVAMVELPAVAPGAHMRRPEIKERIQKPVLMGGFEGVPQQAAREIRENIAQEKETAVVQQRPPMRGHTQHAPGRRPVEPPTVVNASPAVPNAVPPETVRPASAAEKPAMAPTVPPVETATVQQQPGQGSMPQGSRRHSPEGRPATNLQAQETVRPAVAVEPGADAAREPRRRGQPGMGVPQALNVPPESKVVENSAPAAAPSTPSVMPAVVDNKAPEPSAAPVVPVVEPERTAPPAVVSAPPAVMPQPPADPIVSQQPVAAEAERTRMHAGREQAQAAAMEQRQQQEMLERGLAEKKAAEQAAVNAEAEKSRMQATAAQQEAQAAQQQRLAADQAAAETEKARQQAAATAAQQQQEMAAQQQRATAERMASEQAAAAEAERVRQQTEAAAMQQRQQEEATRRAAEEQQMKAQQETERRTQEMAQRQAEEQARRAAEEQQMRAQQETERRAQEMAQRQAEDTARRQQEAEMQRAQEQARRAAEEQQMRAQQEAAQRVQEMAQRQAEEQARRQQEGEMQRAQEQARRAAEEQQMRAQQEAVQRAQEMAQRQAEEQARRQQEAEMQRAQEQARRAAQEQQVRAQQEAVQRAQEMAQRQAEEQARRAQEMAQRQAEEQARRAQEEAQRAAAEAAQRAAAEAARNQPQPGS